MAEELTHFFRSITVAVIGVSGKDLVVLAGNWFAKGEGKSGELTASLDISVLKSFPGLEHVLTGFAVMNREYVLVFVDDDDHDKLLAKSKAFRVKKSDF
ncbi:hypothetical protein FS837_000424 [Tulasnella sp. UAMH 9824]|nr:hypothetical protein FS837_000424 [Tulasnella sp. UAMH 9824]